MKIRSLAAAFAAFIVMSTAFSGVADAGLLSKVIKTVTSLTTTGELRLHPDLTRLITTKPDTRLRVIVQKSDSSVLSSTLASLASVKVIEEFGFIDAFVVEIRLKDLPLLANDSRVGFISPDGGILRHDGPDTAAAARAMAYPGAVRADAAQAAGATGRGVTVAVVDTGVSNAHPDLQGRVTQVKSNGSASSAADLHGHGTHVAGIIAGARGEYAGIAPEARILGVRIADDTGLARESDLIRGLQWVYNNRTKYNIRAVNLSVTAATPSSYLTSPTSAAAERLWFAGVVVVVAAGNHGADTAAGWHAPANDPYVITVGCVDDAGTAAVEDDSACVFSSRGGTIEGFTKPDVAAPGRRIVSALASPTATVAQLYPDRVDGDRIRLSGTSMSAPVVTGTVALLLERYPSLTPNQVKWLLVQTAQPYAGQSITGPIVDAQAALDRAAAGGVGSANAGNAPSPGRLLSPLGLLLSLVVDFGSAYWDSAYWDSAYWDSAYWDSAYWDSAYWDSAYWDTSGAHD